MLIAEKLRYCYGNPIQLPLPHVYINEKITERQERYYSQLRGQNISGYESNP